MVILIILILLILVILIRTLRFKPKAEANLSSPAVSVNEEKIVADMQSMIRCKTVSDRDESAVDWTEFEKFQTLLNEIFPKIHEKTALLHLGKTGLLYHLPGKDSKKCAVMMAHYDVVPAEEDAWDKPPFEGIVEDGILWGRGTLDTKGSLLGIMEALEQLLGDGFVPACDLYLSFSGDEEISGSSCPAIVDWFQQQGITPDLVLDEGGAVVDHSFPGYDGMCAMVGIAEKGFMNVKFSMDSQGGHASTPPAKQVLGHLSRALLKLEKQPFPCRFTKPVLELFNTAGRHSNFFYRMIFSNLWCFKPVLNLVGKLSGGELSAMMRTSVALTMFEGSKAYNVLPPHGSFGANLRLMPGETMDSAMKYLKKVIGNENITVTALDGNDPSPVSDLHCEAWETVKTAIRQTWPEAVVSPYLMLACSDSRHYNRITDKVYRFSPMHLSKEERKMIHGNNERIPVETLCSTVKFYLRLLQQL